MRQFISLLVLLTISTVCWATENWIKQTTPPTPPIGWHPFVRGAAVAQGKAGLDAGGDFSVNRYYAEGGVAYLFRADRRISFSAGAGQDDFDFSDVPTEPWNKINTARLTLFSKWAFTDKWTVIAVPGIRAYAEDGASMSDATTESIMGGVFYAFSDTLTLGPGVGVFSQLEEQSKVIPIIIVDWKITDNWRLTTGGGLAAMLGPGLTLTYTMTQKWSIGVSGRYESSRFRLRDGSVGERSSLPLLGSLSYDFNRAIGISLLA